MFEFFRAVGTAIANFYQKHQIAIQLGLMAAQGIQAHRTNKKLKKGQEILLTKYGTGDGIPVIYGTRRAAGTVVFMETVNQKELFVVYAIAVGEVDDIDDLRIDGRSINDTSVYRQGFTLRKEGSYFGGTVAVENTVDIANVLGGANTTDNPRMVFNVHHGSSSQEADPMLFHVFDGTDATRPNSWTADHKLSGIAYIAANFEYDTQGMFTGIPNLTARVKGKKVLDTRTSATGYSSNPAMCLRDYLTNDEYGKGIASGDLDATSFNTAANDCDSGVQTISHTSVPVLSASAVTDRVKLQNESDFNKIKTGTTIAFASGGTTYFSGRVLDKDSTIFREDGDSATSYAQHYYLLMDEGAVTTAINSTTSGTITETQPRFECHAVIDTDETVLENTKDLIANMRGIFTYTNGTYSLDVEGTESSVVSLDEDDILESGLELALENKEQKYNKVEVEFYNSSKKYEADTVVVTDGLSDDGNEVLEHRAQFPFVTNQRVAYNHAEAILNRSRNNRSVSFVATPKVLKARVGEVITITSSDLNLSAEPYRITQMNIMPDLNIQVSAVEYQASVYGWQDPPAEDIGSNPTPPDPFRVVKPTSLAYVAKNTTTGEPAKLTWSDSVEYPSFEFRVQILSDSNSKTRFDKRVKATEIYLDGINIDTGFVAKVSAINSLGTESDPVELTFAVTTAPITTVDIGQGSIGGFSFDATKMYHGTGTFNNTNTAVYFDNTGQFSLKDKLSWNGTTLNISGNLTVENTINANKIVLDGNNLADLFSSTSSGVNSTISTNSKIQRFNWVDGTSTTHYGLYIDNTGTYGQIGIGTVSQPSDAIHVYNSGARLRLETASGGYVRVKGSGASMELEAGNTGSGYDNTASILLDISGNDVAKFHALGGMELPSLTPSTTTNRLYQNSGTLFWNGNQVGVGAITSVTNMADNRMITASGSNSLNGEANMTFDGTTLALTGNQTISGDLTVSGTTTTIDTTNLDVKDKNITLNFGSGDTSSNADGAGITIQDAVSASTDATILWNASADRFDFSHGLRINADNQVLTVGAGGDFSLSHNGTDTFMANNTGHFYITTTSDDKDIIFRTDDGSGGVTSYLTIDGSASLTKFNINTKHLDNVKATFGDSADLEIYHTGNHSYITDTGTGNLYIRADSLDLRRYANGEQYLTGDANGAVTLFYDGTAKLATTSSGIDVTGSTITDGITSDGTVNLSSGNLQIAGTNVILNSREIRNVTALKMNDNNKILLGTSQDLEIYHNGSHSYIDDTGTGNLYIRANNLRLQKYTGETYISADADGAVGLRYDSVEKLATTSSGVTVTGTLAATAVTGDGSGLTNIPTVTVNNNADNRLITGSGTANTLNAESTATFTAGRLTLATASGGGQSNQPTLILTDTDATLQTTTLKQIDGVTTLTSQNGTGATGAIRFVGVSGAGSINNTQYGGFDASGNFEIGTTDVITASRELQNISTGSFSDKVTLSGTTDEILTLNSTDNGAIYMSFERGFDRHAYVGFGGSSDAFYIANEESGGSVIITSGNSTALTINSSQVATFENTVDVKSQSTLLQRWYEGSTEVGRAVSVSSTLMAIGSGDTGVLFNANVNAVYPWQPTTNAGLDNVVDLGISSRKWRDIYFGGNLKHGSTTVIDNSRNLTNIGTVASGAITSSAGVKIASDNALIGGGASGGDTQLIFWNGTNAYYGRNSLGGSVSQHEFRTGGTTRLTIDSSGRVGIGTSSPSAKLEIVGIRENQIRLSSSDTTVQADEDIGGIEFYSNDSGNTGVTGFITATSEDAIGTTKLKFGTGAAGSASDKMTLDSSGRLLIGKTVVDNATVGFRFDGASGFASIARDGGEPLYLNRKTSDGEVIKIAKNDSVKGSIGVDNADNLVIEGDSSHSGLQFGTATILPHKNGAVINNNISLGNSTYKFSNLTLGGTATVNQVSINGTTVINSSRNLTNIGTIASGNITTSGSSPTNTLQDSDGTNQLSTLAQDGGSFILTARNNTSNGNIIFKGNNGSSVSEYGRFNSSGNFSSEGNVTVGSALKMGSTTVIDSSRNLTNINEISLASELNFTGNGNKYIDVSTLALSNALTIRHHNPSGNLFETAMIMYANGGTVINYDGSGRLSTTSAGASITGSLNITSAITHSTHGTILDSSANLTNINNVYASGYRIGSTTVIDSSRNLTNIVNGTLTGTLDVSGNVTFFDETADAHHSLTLQKRYNKETAIKWARGSDVDAQIRVGDSENLFIDYNHSNTGDSVIFRNNSSEVARFDNSGRVGIGATPNANVLLHVQGEIGTTNGTASDPTHTFYGDPNTGMFRAAVDTLAFTTGGTERARIDSSGRVMVGTTNIIPGVGNTDAGVSLSATLGVFASRANEAPINLSRNSSDGDIAIFRKDGTTVGVIGTQNWGIGTSSPSVPLHITNSSARIRLQDSDGTNQFTTLTQDGGLFTIFARNNTNKGSILFSGTDTSGATEYARFDNSGRLGIGTTSPSTKLEVAGNITLPSDGQIKFRGTNHYPRIFASSNNLLVNVDNGSGTNFTALTIDNGGTTTLKGGTADTSDHTLIIRNSSNTSLFSIRNDGRIDLGGSQIFDISRNMSNIGTISSGNITATRLVSDAGNNYSQVKLSGDNGTNGNSYRFSLNNNNTLLLQRSTDNFAANATLALTIDSSQNATFAGLVTAPNFTSNGDITISEPTPKLRLTDTDTGADSDISGSSSNGSLFLSADTNNEVANTVLAFQVDGATKAYIGTDGLYTQTGSSSSKILDNSTRNLTNIGTISSGNITVTTSGITSNLYGNDLIFNRAGASYIRQSGGGSLLFTTSTSNTTALTLNSSQNATFAGHIFMAQQKTINFGGLAFARMNASGNFELGDIDDDDREVKINGFAGTSQINMGDGSVAITGALSKSSGSFKIDHPLKPDTHHLVHSFVESPQADNIYSGVINLQNGRAIIDLDDEFNMTPGTFLALNRELRAFVNNEDTWDMVRAKVMGSQLIIDCQNHESKAQVSWMVIGERQDKEIHQSTLTNEHGKIVVEPEKVG